MKPSSDYAMNKYHWNIVWGHYDVLIMVGTVDLGYRIGSDFPILLVFA